MQASREILHDNLAAKTCVTCLQFTWNGVGLCHSSVSAQVLLLLLTETLLDLA
jgi:hypothetical protein